MKDKTVQTIKTSRRSFLRQAGVTAVAPFAISSLASANPLTGDVTLAGSDIGKLQITGIELHIIRVNQRGDWYFVEVKTKKGLTGIGECSHAFPKTYTTGERCANIRPS